METGWMFDVDGVILSLITKRVDECILQMLAYLLYRGEPITFNSGGSPFAIAKAVLSPLEQYIGDRMLLSRVMVVGEKGGAWATYASDGILHVTFDTTLSVPYMLKAAIEELAQEPQFADLMEMDSGKRTMMSIVKRRGIPLALFHQAQSRFVQCAQACIADCRLSVSWKSDAVSDSIEIEHMSASKGKGARKIMQWMHRQGIRPQRMIAFEDSPSGVEMANVLHDLHVPVEFVFTGPQPLVGSHAFPVIHTERKYEQGTREYLSCYYQESLARG
jgi:hydroxymethylpyrimidine pyrophosphatase-like HAD family hydrolase